MYKYNLHVHSSIASDCAANTVEEMMKRHKEIGFSGFALTNHFLHGNTGIDRKLPWKDFVNSYSSYYYNALETAQKLDFDLLFGVEEGYAQGKEFLVYGISPDILLAHPELQNFGIENWTKVVRENNGFIAYAHPFRVAGYIPDPYTMPDISLVDGIEAYNMGNTPESNELAFENFKDSGKILIAGGDLHRTNFEDSFGIKVKERIKTAEQLVKVLKENNFEIYLGK
jgi:predicted metal-dependent phosphoesterase TrpH